jgi:hypothetical protein
MANRALGAPIFFSIDGDDVGVWAVGARAALRLLEPPPVDRLPALFARNRDSWTPHAPSCQGAAPGPGCVTFDFIDLGLPPTIEQGVQRKFQRTMAEDARISGRPA